MPEVERPEFRKDAKPTERSYGKCDGAKQGIVRGEGLLSFCNGCEGGSIRCNGRGKLYSVIT